MNTLPAIPINNDPGYSRERKIVGNINQYKPASSVDGSITSRPFGSRFNVHDASIVPPMEFAGDFDPSASYYQNQVVRVTQPIIASNSQLSHSYGVWLCNYAVPAYGFDSVIINAGLNLADFSGSYRVAGCLYYPRWPEPVTDASVTNPSGSYWKLIGMLPAQMNACINGQLQSVYIGIISGSTSP